MSMMSQEQRVTTSRAIKATRIPSGEAAEIEQGTELVITQALGGSLTVLVPGGGLFRVEAAEASVLGIDWEPVPAVSSGGSLEEAIWEQLRSCYDPEIPVNIVDLGLIYSMEATALESGGHAVSVKMTLTAPGCGMGPVIGDEARRKILALDGVAQAVVEVVWDPPWGPERISPEGRKKLGIE